MAGCVHIYTGDGKGKTTAAVGLAVRFAGHGGKVLFTQFLKDGSSCEIGVLRGVLGITVYSCRRNLGFSFAMDEAQRAEARDCCSDYLDEILKMAANGGYGLLVLDEVIAACRLGFVKEERLTAFLQRRPAQLEVVLTGRDPSRALLALADYVTEMKKIRHPYDGGTAAREGIER